MNFINNNIRTLVLVALFSASVFMAVAGGPTNPSPTSSLSGTVTLADPLPVIDKYGRVLSAVDYTTNLATNTITRLDSVCSWTVPCQILFNHRGTQWITFNAGDASATAQTRRRVKEDTEWMLNVATTTVIPRFIADPTATSSLGITVFTTTQ